MSLDDEGFLHWNHSSEGFKGHLRWMYLRNRKGNDNAAYRITVWGFSGRNLHALVGAIPKPGEIRF